MTQALSMWRWARPWQYCGIDPLQLHHKIENFWISPYTDAPPPPSWCTTSVLTPAWPFVLAAAREHNFLSSYLLATQGQNKQCPMLIFAWNYSTYCNFTGCRQVILPERAAESRSNTFSRRHAPVWYTKMAVVTWPDHAERQLQWVYSAREYAEVEHMQCKDFVDDQVEKLPIFSYTQPKDENTDKSYRAHSTHDAWNVELTAESLSRHFLAICHAQFLLRGCMQVH